MKQSILARSRMCGRCIRSDAGISFQLETVSGNSMRTSWAKASEIPTHQPVLRAEESQCHVFCLPQMMLHDAFKVLIVTSVNSANLAKTVLFYPVLFSIFVSQKKREKEKNIPSAT
ncbi:hypothetical protein PGIGA_G00019520 [Pangasianodon gigas]|uniref:Uncharacterized protein n=1 Tax=Pangasianodon gigas TaxID=30993 RepID=A0ACC5WV17_PANGG|nr:hypothetical protein [Pangasianodon gigas]